MQTPNTTIPISMIVSRMTNHREYFEKKLAALPWWALKRKWIYAAAAAVYEHEANSHLEVGGRDSLSRVLGIMRW